MYGHGQALAPNQFRETAHQPYGVSVSPLERSGGSVRIDIPESAPETRSTRGFFGKVVHSIKNPSQTMDKISKFASAFMKDLCDYTVDSVESLAILAKNTFRYMAYGAAAGLITGGVVSAYSPFLVTQILPFTVGCGATAGAIYGFLHGSNKASDHFNHLQEQRAIQSQQEVQPNPFTPTEPATA